MIKRLTEGIKLYFLLLVLVIIYNSIIYYTSHYIWPEQAAGSLIIDKGGNVRGSYLISQDFDLPIYFKGRPHNILKDHCDVALYNEGFKEMIFEVAKSSNNHMRDISMFTISLSALDPYITKEEAIDQASKIALARNMQLQKVLELINENTTQSWWPFFSKDIVNVMRLNAALGFK